MICLIDLVFFVSSLLMGLDDLVCGPIGQRVSFGHFRQEPFDRLYEEYAEVLVPAARDYSLEEGTGQLCMIFLQEFHQDHYQLKSLDKLVLLDACLGYLNSDQQRHLRDRSSSQLVDNNLDYWRRDERLAAIYNGTQIANLPTEAKVCLSELLGKLIEEKRKLPGEDCDQQLADVLINFAECQHSFGLNQQQDSYLRMVNELAGQRARVCVESQISSLNNMTATGNDEDWPTELGDLLDATTGLSGDDNKLPALQQLNELIRDQRLSEVSQHLARYAQSHLSPLTAEASEEYGRLMQSLCANWLPANSEFAGSLMSLLRMLRWPEVFGLDEDRLADIVADRRAAPSYFAVAACQLAAASEAQYNGAMGVFEVSVAPQRATSVWPDVRLF